MSVILDFLSVAKGHVVWIDILTQNNLFQGKVEAFDACHLLISNELGFDCISVDQIADISLPKQTEIIV
jgi:hypothetical protein